ncbi:MAG: HD domain-containing protein [Calditrichaeota bacterium]|nr:HD domain-containing protein [Calditrichota bacterium]
MATHTFEKETEDLTRIYHPAPLATLRPDRGAHFDLFLGVPTRSGQRYVLYKSADIDLTDDKRKELIERGVQFLYVTDDDAGSYFNFVDRTVGEALQDESASPEQRSQVLYQTTKALVQATFTRPESPVLMKTNRSLVEHTVEALAAEPGLLRALASEFSMDYSLYTHAVHVSTLATALMLEINGPDTSVKDAAMGFLLHDIGKCRVPTQILRKSGILTTTEMKEVEKHPEYGVALMRPHIEVGDVALDIIHSHHEKLNGRGYPRRLPPERISLETRICSLVDIYDALTSHRVYKPAMHGFEALTYMREKMYDELDPGLLKQLIKILGPRDR